ncbi:hypothetical protein [Qipengyuania qiaonensis]|uniref:Autotransporter outer membrane beta-barrel domain-containing protein n=1 Tax=Qipengyuania qiaonensis TaxID=2867240 RepID=A0ABS7JA65_9SPHN|nr:hypothetical protein [Qipengyuania qiaonensis]MBX7483196.1 hypothetical protein [Qipengyuania qiaonensis]
MHNLIAQRQGQPVLFLGLLAAGWFLLRILTWQNPWMETEILSQPFMLVGEGAGAASPVPHKAANSELQTALSRNALPEQAHILALSHLKRPRVGPASGPSRYENDGLSFVVKHAARGMDGCIGDCASVSVASPDDRPISASFRTIPGEGAMVPSIPGLHISDWRVDAWLVLREGAPTQTDGGTLPASYGGSQVGAVLAYRLAPASRLQPAAYFRANRAMGSNGQTDGALGLRVRPLKHVPVDIHVEARLTDREGATEIRPAAFVAGGFDRVTLPLDLSARGYGQAGYVGGDFATPFADGAVVAEREAMRLGTASLAVGTGMWGGAQKGASRFDVGPAVTVNMVAGKAAVRLEAGYRIRAAGNAAPGNSGVLTLSTGF